MLYGTFCLLALLPSILAIGDSSTTTEQLDLSIFDDPPQTSKPFVGDIPEALPTVTPFVDGPAYVSAGNSETKFPSIPQPENTFQFSPPSPPISSPQYFLPVSGMLPINPLMPSNTAKQAPSISYLPSYQDAAPKQSVPSNTKKPITSSMYGFQSPPYPYAPKVPYHSSIPGLSGNSYVSSKSLIPQAPPQVSSVQKVRPSGNSVPLAPNSFRTYTPTTSFFPQSQGNLAPIVGTFVRTYVPPNQPFVNYSPTQITSLPPPGVLTSSPSFSLNEIISSQANSHVQTPPYGLSSSFVPSASYISIPVFTTSQSSASSVPAARIVSSIIRAYPPTPIQANIPFVSLAPIMPPQTYYNSKPSFSTYGNIPSVPYSWPVPAQQ